jgi:hypothetical protein
VTQAIAINDLTLILSSFPFALGDGLAGMAFLIKSSPDVDALKERT